MGTPVVAVVKPDRIVMAAPQVLPSPLMEDNGTSRFAKITPEIMIAHSGLSADGRVLLTAAQGIAIQHEYTYDESIPIELLLEDLASLFQEYTMKPSVRPFGAILLIGYMPAKSSRRRDTGKAFTEPMLFRIDPSGTVEGLKDYAIVNGHLDRTQLPTNLKELVAKEDAAGDSSSSSWEESLARALQASLQEQASKKVSRSSLSTDGENQQYDDPIETIISASITSGGCYRVDRFEGLQ